MGDNEEEMVAINDYELKEVLGKGAYGTVMRVVGPAGDEYACKMIDKKKMKRTRVGRHSNALESCRTEIAIWKKLDHPNVVKLWEVVDDDDARQLFLVSELIDGGACMPDTLQATPIGALRSRHLFRQLLLGLEYLHLQAVVHRDIKPSNLLVTMDGKLLITDFGVSQVFDPEDDLTRKTAGTTAFQAPEMITGQMFHSAPTDNWAAGATLFMFVFGHPPFVAKTIPELYDAIEKNPVVVPDRALCPPLPEVHNHPAGRFNFNGDGSPNIDRCAGPDGEMTCFVISDDLREILMGVLNKDAEERLTIAQMKQARWVVGQDAAPLNSANSEKIIVDDGEIEGAFLNDEQSVASMVKVKIGTRKWLNDYRLKKSMHEAGGADDGGAAAVDGAGEDQSTAGDAAVDAASAAAAEQPAAADATAGDADSVAAEQPATADPMAGDAAAEATAGDAAPGDADSVAAEQPATAEATAGDAAAETTAGDAAAEATAGDAAADQPPAAGSEAAATATPDSAPVLNTAADEVELSAPSPAPAADDGATTTTTTTTAP